MNIETLLHHINLFQNKIVESGFKRDLTDYISSLPANQNNIVSLRDISENCKTYLNEIYNSDLPNALNQLLPTKTVVPFTKKNHLEIINELINDKEIQVSNYYAKLSNFLNQLDNEIQTNITEAQVIKNVMDNYSSKENDLLLNENAAIVSILFKDNDTIKSLKLFSKTITLWNRTIPIYQQIISKKSPQDIEIVEVQNGSIDLLINIDFNVAVNLAELFEIGFKCYLSYLTYKSLAKPITETFYGNKKLIELEAEKEKELLNNIEVSISNHIFEQNKKARKIDKTIDDKIDKKVEEVKKLITSHIIRGNDIKLLSMPEIKGDEENSDEKANETQHQLEEVSLKVRNAIKNLPNEEKKLLMDRYGKIN